MFESIKAHMTTRNVLIATAGLVVVGAAAYYLLSDNEVPAEGIAGVVEGAIDAVTGAAEATADVAATTVEAVVEATEQAAA